MNLLVRSLPEQLVDLVRERILSGAVSSGQAIRQDTLAAELGISKIPLREALARLEEEGLLQSHANRGFFVRSLSASEAREVYELRLRLEPDSTALAARLATEADHRHAIAALERLDQSIQARSEDIGARHRDFHRALFGPCAKPITIGILDRLHVLSDRYVKVHLAPLGRNDRAKKEHHEMLQAWLGREDKAVAAFVKAHNRKTLDDLAKQLDNT